MSSRRSEVLLLIGMLALGGTLYALRWLAFPGQALHNEMWRFLLGDVAFLFLQVAIVTLFVDRLLRSRERQVMLRKLNMVIGAFFSELGTQLLGRIASLDASLDQVREDLVPDASWTADSYARAKEALGAHEPHIALATCDFDALKRTLVAEKPFLLGLLSNQTLLEHEAFTELLWAVTHLAEELDARGSLDGLPAPDVAHLEGDVNRAYALLTSQWLDYVRHLQTQYPYLFSLAVRTNPLDPDACANVSS